MIPLILYLLFLLSIELIYFRIADKFDIIDKPNQRSSHQVPIIRGGGIIFIIGLWIWFVISSFQWPYFILGATLVAFISFLDDIRQQSTLARFLFHLISILLLFYQVGLFDWTWWLVGLALIVSIGSLNAFNFMDGINGISGAYALVNLGCFVFIDQYLVSFTDEMMLYMIIIAVVVFLIFNFRTKAKCFAGDVGSITIAYVQVFILLQLIVKTNNLFWVIMFLVFGIDSIVTIIYRLKGRENIFKPHRTHLYQLLTNELRYSHQGITIYYALMQLLLNGMLIYFLPQDNFVFPLVSSIFFAGMYVLIRYKVTKRVTQIIKV